MDLKHFARVGDSVECDVKLPAPGSIRMQLLTSVACAYANDLLADPASGWRLVEQEEHGATAAGPSPRQ